MLMIRLRRVGAKKHAQYRIVVSDSRKRPTADFIDQVGLYDPNTEPPKVQLDREKIADWTGKGARLSETVRSLVKAHDRGSAEAADTAAE